MSFIRTLTGDIAPADLGLTYAHDDLYCVPSLWKEKGEIDLLIDDVEVTINESGRDACYDGLDRIRKNRPARQLRSATR
jgi:predicted metal-dependent phosphotriesterase family hydrolase